MRAKVTPTSVTFTGISSEPQLSDIESAVERTGCKATKSDLSTKVVVTGTTAQITKFINKYNK